MGYYDFPHTRNYDTDLGFLIDWFKTNKNKIEENTAITIEKALTATEEAIKAYNSATSASNSATSASNSATSASNSAALALELKNQTEALKDLMQDKIDQIDTNTNRINNLATINQGSITTTADAELVDIRVGANGTTYPSAGDAVRGQVSELKDNIVDIETSFFNDTGELFLSNVNINNGSYITSDNMTILSNESMSYTDSFVVYPNDTIKCQAYGYLDRVAILSEWDENNTPKSVIQKSNNQVSSFEWTNTSIQIKRVKFCYQNDKPHRLHVIRGDWYKASNTKKVEENSKELFGLTEITDLLTYYNLYIDSSNLHNVPNDGTLTSELIVLKPLESVLIFASGYSTNISIITLCDSNGNNKKMITQSNGSIQKYIYTNLSLGKEYIKVSFDNLFYRVYKKEHEIPYGFSISMFETIGIIGDSFSSGALGEYGYADFYNVSWGQILGRKNGVSVTNYSKGGLTTSTWISDTNKGLPKLLSDNAKNLYTFNLGLNDASLLVDNPSYLGNISDISDANYDSNPDTFYGNTGRIISNIKVHAPLSKIIMFTVPTYSNVEKKKLINAAIKEIANHFNVPVIDVVENTFFKSNYFIDYMINGHPTAVLYSAMADEYQKLIEACLSEKISYFNDYKPN